ncbi:zinc ABC transporter substrate-binding protein [Nocardiopsis gilva YIM 90087]|uniref:Zinc ABC transporter substrate-binding protein n=1 Tax=Nocardiopsis gilva YIM 90087 TaxID=1235441 RepID=A0A223SAE0_9ACTN|nr:metal ABC transporter substrate-binding protein [Nocardiopsis gilva]ASU85094.1 zinc ABC transporter substrate-binding protein [Nocardiopsis gilva YIM 90087]
MRSGRVAARVAAGVAISAIAAGCGTASDSGSDGDGSAVSVITGVYPLEWLATQVGGDRVEVTNLTEPGAEPHDLELSPPQIRKINDADVNFYVHGLQPAIDDALEQQPSERVLDVGDLVELLPSEVAAGEDKGHDHEGEDAEEHGNDEESGDGHDHGGTDPHMWQDPQLMAEAATGLAKRLAEVDPDHADTYTANAEKVGSELDAIDDEYSTGLAECTSRDLLTNHSAFGYLAHRYDLHQVGISGLNPETEPSPARIAEISDLVKDEGITTVFTETLASPAVAETIASETGAKTAVLDPIEGITDQSPGDDYPSVMRANLKAISKGLGCS